MKPSNSNVNFQLPGFINFFLAVIKRLVFLACLFLGVLIFSLQFVGDGFSQSPVIYLGIVFVGFVWSAFQVYRDLSRAYQKAITPVAFEKNRRVGLAISFVPGSEYAYSISDPYSGRDIHITRMQNTKGMNCRFDERGIFYINDQVYYMMGKGSLEINIQIQNTGDHPLEVTAIYVQDDLDLNHLRIYSDGLFLHGSRQRLPFQLASREIVTLQSRHTISSAMGSNDDLFAADFRALPRFILHEVIVEANDVDGRRLTFTSEIKTPSKSFVDLYVRQWREYEQQEYLVLAGHGPTSGT